MPGRGERGPGGPEVGLPAQDFDSILADAQRAADAARLQAEQALQNAGKEGEERIKRVEVLAAGIGAVSAEDPFVEDFAFESVLLGVENETGMSAPAADKAIADLRRAATSVRNFEKQSTSLPQTPELQSALARLREARNQLFESVRGTVLKSLDQLKKKYKGEKTALEEALSEIKDSAFLQRVEFKGETPEERERALKQEIEELLFRPLAQGLLRKRENEVRAARANLQKAETNLNAAHQAVLAKDAKAAFAALTAYRGHGRDIDQDFGVSYWGPGYSPEASIQRPPFAKNQIELALQKERETVEPAERDFMRASIAFEVNRTIVRETLAEAKDETELTAALTELREYLGALRDIASNQNPQHTLDKIPRDLKSPLAKKILGRLVGLGVSIMRNDRTEINVGNQLVPSVEMRNWREQAQKEAQGASHRIDDLGTAWFYEERVSEELKPAALYLADNARNFNIRFAPEPSGAVRDMPSGADQTAVKKLLAQYPTAQDLQPAILRGLSRDINRLRALERVDAGLRTTEPHPYQQSPVTQPGLPEGLGKAGWTETKSGALVEPGADAKKVEAEMVAMLEKLSKSHVDAAHAFDERGPKGEIVIHTLGQAHDVIRRMRGDAMRIVERLTHEGAEARGKAGGLERAKGETATAFEQEKKERQRVERDLKETRELITALEEKTRLAEAKASRTRNNVEQARRGMRNALQETLRTKDTIMGGSKPLRTRLEEIIKDIEKLTPVSE